MLQTVLIALPGLAALIVCMARGPEEALLDVYLPTLLLLPQFAWPISCQMTFGDTAILPIGLFLLFRRYQRRQWSSLDLLLISYLAITVVSQTVNLGGKRGLNLALREFFAIFLPYYAVRQTLGRQQFAVDFAKRIVMLLVVVAIISVWEFRMGSVLFLRPFVGIFPPPGNTTVFRAGFMRTQGPFGHAMAAGTMMAVGYRIARWLDWNGTWSDRMWFLPISKIRFCELWIVAGSIMTISVGPWLGWSGGAVALFICRARNRRRASALVLLVIVVVCPLVYSAFNAYTSVDRFEAMAKGDKLQEDAAYRRELLPLYIPVVEARPTWGWGVASFPAINGMPSIDNGYLWTALTFGLYALGLWVAILVWSSIRLCAFGLRLPRGDPAALAAFSLMAIYVIVAIENLEGAIPSGAQVATFFFLVTGWSAALLKSEAGKVVEVEAEAPQLRPQFAFRKVMV